MIITFYDRLFVAMQNNSGLNVGDWALKRKAADLDDFSCTSEAFLFHSQPVFMVLADDAGKYKYGCFAGVPQLTSDNQTKETGSDLRSYFNSYVYVKITNIYTTLSAYLQAIYSIFKSQIDQSTISTEFDTSEITDINMDLLVPDMSDYASKNLLYDLMVPYLNYYKCHLSARLDLINKKIVFKVYKASQKVVDIHLDEYKEYNYGKNISSINEVQVVVNYNGAISYGNPVILLKDNSILQTATPNLYRDIYPVKKKFIVKSATGNPQIPDLLVDGLQEAIENLASARFNEALEIDTSADRSKFEGIDFSWSFDLYYRQGATYVFYKRLPLGAISEGRSGGIESATKITIGFKNDDIVFYIK